MKLPKPVYNWITFLGALMAVMSLFFIIGLSVISMVFNAGGSYIGIFIYMVFPAILFMGLILIPIGMFRKMRIYKKQKPEEQEQLPIFDLNKKTHRNAFLIFSISSLIILFFSVIGSYEAFHYTESVQFCGKLCHDVMEPEFVAYQNSPHARVKCVECHVGEGASWYMRSKLSGLYQVYAVLADTFPKPIPTPLQNLRPARETCEKCHWPQKFYSRKIASRRSFLTDSLNTEWDVILQMKIGPEFSALGLKEGSHWHINPDIKIEYVSESDNRENILWVKYTNKSTGETHIYKPENQEEIAVNTDSLLSVTQPRVMDCMDCHNRPSHNYLPPQKYIDHSLLNGSIPKDIPFIKYISMQILKETFGQKDTALMYIDKKVKEYYTTTNPEYYKNNTEKVKQAITGIQNSFQKNYFPFMKVNYSVYPDHIGHLVTNGCFRCHSDKMKTTTGRIIKKDCNLCHTIVGQGKSTDMKMGNLRDTMQFVHPVDIGEEWKVTNCKECHSALY